MPDLTILSIFYVVGEVLYVPRRVDRVGIFFR